MKMAILRWVLVYLSLRAAWHRMDEAIAVSRSPPGFAESTWLIKLISTTPGETMLVAGFIVASAWLAMWAWRPERVGGWMVVPWSMLLLIFATGYSTGKIDHSFHHPMLVLLAIGLIDPKMGSRSHVLGMATLITGLVYFSSGLTKVLRGFLDPDTLIRFFQFHRLEMEATGGTLPFGGEWLLSFLLSNEWILVALVPIAVLIELSVVLAWWHEHWWGRLSLLVVALMHAMLGWTTSLGFSHSVWTLVALYIATTPSANGVGESGQAHSVKLQQLVAALAASALMFVPLGLNVTWPGRSPFSMFESALGLASAPVQVLAIIVLAVWSLRSAGRHRPPRPSPDGMFLYDRDCGFCQRFVTWQTPRTASTMQWAPCQEAAPELECKDRSYFLAGGRRWDGAEAVRCTWALSTGPWSIALRPLSWTMQAGWIALVAAEVYAWIARNRFMFGDQACVVEPS